MLHDGLDTYGVQCFIFSLQVDNLVLTTLKRAKSLIKVEEANVIYFDAAIRLRGLVSICKAEDDTISSADGETNEKGERRSDQDS